MAATDALSPQLQNTDVISSSTFTQTWSPSAANAFDVTTLPIQKARKAWERRPQAPRNQAAKYKKVWKTYGLRSTNDSQDDGSGAEAENDRARAVKRMCINETAAPVASVIKTRTRKNYAGTKFDRRRSGITRKTRVFRDDDDPDSAGDQQAMPHNALAIESETVAADTTNNGRSGASPERAVTTMKKRKALGRHSLGANRTARRSLGAFTFGSIPEEPVNEVDALCLSPRKKRRPSLRKHAANVSTETETEGRDETTKLDEVPENADEESPVPDSESPGPAAVNPDSGVTHADDPRNSALMLDVPSAGTSTDNTEQVQDPGKLVDIPQEQEDNEEDPENEVEATKSEEPVEELPSWSDETTTHLDLDTALLKDFLSRTAAAKATRLESGTRLSLPRRASLQNRRDSDAIRMALASPRKPLDDKDPNSPATSPMKMMDLPGVKGLAAQLDAITGGPLGNQLIDAEDEDITLSGTGSRRSARQRSRLPGPLGNEKTPNKISVKRTDGSEPVIMKKTEAQELSVMTRTNTRRNKGTSLARLTRLKKLKFEGLAEHWTEGKVKELAAMNTREDGAEGVNSTSEAQDGQPAWKVPAAGAKGVRWKAGDDLLSFFGAAAALDGTSGLSTEDVTSKLPMPSSLEAPLSLGTSVLPDTESPRKKAQPARMRRLRGLGAANGTPGKGLLSSASLLPDEVTEEKEKEKSRLQAPKERKSRIAAPTPKKLKLTNAKGDENAPSMLKAPEVSVPQSLMGMAAAPSLGLPTKVDAKEMSEARERRLASPRKIPQFTSGLTGLSSAGTRRKRM